ncbi:MAG: hypothetical protein K0U98_08770 [Deltaproteobacteria bacterium]|nr:hypothetical protein [Deltaproteobacteria bacterium]
MLLGEPLTAVLFAQDCIEFHFERMTLRAFTPPWVRVVCGASGELALDSSDAFRALVGNRVHSLGVREGRDIVVRFSEEKQLIIPLTGNSAKAPVAAHFIPESSPQVQVWNLVDGGERT